MIGVGGIVTQKLGNISKKLLDKLRNILGLKDEFISKLAHSNIQTEKEEQLLDTKDINLGKLFIVMLLW